MRKHPFLLGVLLLFTIGLLSVLFFLGINAFAGGKSLLSLKDKIGVVFIEDAIVESRSTTELLNRYGGDDRVKAVVVRIDSPGGAVAPSQEIFDAVKTLKTKKRVVVSMGSTAVSGGYYIACAADRIIANPGTVTGSIGALLQYSNREELLKKIGLESSVIKSGKFKDIGSPVRPMTSEEKDLIQGVLDDIHDQFVEVVSISRNISVEKLRPIADGRIFTGRQALKLGLIDDLGDMDYSVEVAAKLAGMKEKPELIYPKEKRINFWKFFSDELISSLVKHLRAESIGFQYSPLY